MFPIQQQSGRAQTCQQVDCNLLPCLKSAVTDDIGGTMYAAHRALHCRELTAEHTVCDFKKPPWCNVCYCCRNISSQYIIQVPPAGWTRTFNNQEVRRRSSHGAHLFFNNLYAFPVLSLWISLPLLCASFSLFQLPFGVLQWLSTFSHWDCLWTLMMAVSRTTEVVATSWSQRCSCAVRGTLILAAVSTASNPHTFCLRYYLWRNEHRIIQSRQLYGGRCNVMGVWVCVYASKLSRCLQMNAKSVSV